MTVLLRVVLCALCGLCAACVTTPERIDRTQGLSAELLWISADKTRASYFTVGTDAVFTSAGGAYARERATQYSTQLEDADIAVFVPLARALIGRAACAQAETGDRSDVTIVEQGRKVRCTTVGPDQGVDALLDFCRRISLRQFRDVIDSQPVAGERRR